MTFASSFKVLDCPTNTPMPTPQLHAPLPSVVLVGYKEKVGFGNPCFNELSVSMTRIFMEVKTYRGAVILSDNTYVKSDLPFHIFGNFPLQLPLSRCWMWKCFLLVGNIPRSRGDASGCASSFFPNPLSCPTSAVMK